MIMFSYSPQIFDPLAAGDAEICYLLCSFPLIMYKISITSYKYIVAKL